MTGTRLAQPFTSNGFAATKASIYLKVVGGAAPIPVAENAVIDATNFSKVVQGGTQFAVFADDGSNYTGPGYLKVIGAPTIPSEDPYIAFSELNYLALTETEYTQLSEATTNTVTNGGCQISYTVSTVEDGGYTFWLRVKSSSSPFLDAFVSIDGSSFYYFSTAISTNWTWISFPIVLADNKPHIITITPTVGPFDIDQIFVTDTNTVPSGPQTYTTPTYNTVHARIFSSDISGLPVTELPQYDGKSTIEEVVYDDWYNFDITAYTTNTIYGESTVVLNSVGATTSHSLTWEVSKNKDLLYSKSVNGGTWTPQGGSLALFIYSDFDSQMGCSITTPPAVLATKDIENFEIQVYNPIFDNTNTIPYGDDSEYGVENAVELTFDDKIITLIVDESGSMSWQDNKGIRHTVAQDIIDRLHYSYPGKISYNLLSIGTQPVFPVVIPLTTKIVSNSFSQIIRQSFLSNPANFSGFRVVRHTGHFPNSDIDGEEIGTDGYRFAALDQDLPTGVEQFYTVYVYDPAGRFSRGVRIKATPRHRIIPTGIPSFSGSVVIGSGAIIDNHTVGLWHFGEGSGSRIFDFSLSEISYTITGQYYLWIDDAIPTGKYGLRFDGLNSTVTSDSANTPYFTIGTPFTFAGWVKPFLTAAGRQIIFSRSETGTLSYFVYRNGNNVGVAVDLANVKEWSNVLTNNEWNHIAVVYDGTTFHLYINGIVVGGSPSTFSLTGTGVTHLSGSGHLHIGWDPNSALGGKLFGAVTEISLHNTNRDATYISNLAALSGLGDNGDRMVLLSYTIPDDYDFVGGNYRIVVNKLRPPFHENDGDTVAQGVAASGNYTINICDNFDLTYTYFYRIFSQNTLGNWSDIEDCALSQIVIPDIPRGPASISGGEDAFAEATALAGGGGVNNSDEGPGYGNTPTPTIIESRSGNQKNYLKWEVTPNPETHRIRVYYDAVDINGNVTFPYVHKGNIVGAIIFDGLPEDFDFVHRHLNNGEIHYYAVVTLDKYTRFSGLSLSSITASAGDYVTDSGIPLYEPLNVRYRIMDYDQVMISWDSPLGINTGASGYFDQIVYFYAGFLDYTGIPVPIDYPQNIDNKIEITSAAIRSIEDGFHLGGDPAIIPQLPKVSWNVNPGGMITGTLKLANNPILSIVDEVSFSLNVTYTVGSQFSYKMPPTSVTLINPLSLILVNRDASYAPPSCPGKPPIYRDGGYIRRHNPFIIRAIFAFEGTPIPDAQISVLIYDATDNDLSDNNCSATPNINALSTTLSLTTYNIPIQTQTVDVLSNAGFPTGETVTQTYVDLPISAPQLPYKGVVFVRVSYGGYTVVRKMNVWFINILKMSLTAYAPTPNGYDVRQEFTNVWLLDPDAPDDPTKNTIVPDGTLVQWKLVKAGGPVQRPFYSLDNVPLSGVWSRTVAGTAANVYFGPAQNVQEEENYTLTANVSYSGLTASAMAALVILAVKPDSKDPYSTIDTPRFLMEFPYTENVVWADGIAYTKLTISRNPFIATTRFAPCFLTCAKNPIIFPSNTVVHLNAPGWTMYYGDVFEETDPYTNITTLMADNATIKQDTADVPLRSQYTYVYFRINAYIKENGVGPDIKSLLCLSCPSDVANPNQPLTIVTGSTTVNHSGKPVQLIAGGGADGIPVTGLVAKEPFVFTFIGVRTGGEFVNEIAIDGITSYEAVVELSWEGGPVPNGTHVKLMPVFNGITVDIPKTIFTLAQNDSMINPTGPLRSFASVTIPPITPDVSFGAGILFSANYNVVGTVDRTQQVAITFAFIINAPAQPSSPLDCISNNLIKINTSGCAITKLKSMTDARAGHAMETTCTHLYAIGGTDGSIIHNSVEVYDVASNLWSYAASMVYGRVFQQSIKVGQYIYEMGGLTVDTASGEIVSTTTVERYDTLSNTWSSLAPMPFGVIHGVAQSISGKIYILSGYTTTRTVHNQRVLIYNIGSNTWSLSATFTDLQLALYERVSPFVFIRSGVIFVSGGLYHLDATTGVDGNGDSFTIPSVTKYLTSAYSYDPASNIIADAANDFRSLPELRHRGATVSFGNVNYLVGGVNPNSSSLRVMETIDSTTIPFTFATSPCQLIPGRSAFGAVTDYCASGTNIYVSGGVTSGMNTGFLQLKAVPTPSSVRLQGTETAAVNIYVQDENGNAPSSVKVRVQGFIGTGGDASSANIADPILIRTDEIIVHNGKGVATLLPRSDDITVFDGGAVSMSDGIMRHYDVLVQATIIDSFYDGKTITTFDDSVSAPTPKNPSGGVAGGGSAQLVNFGPVKTINFGTTQIYQQVNGGGIVPNGGISSFGLNAFPMPQGVSANLTYYSDFSWIPQVNPLIVTNDGTYDEVTAILSRLAVKIPFGPSPIIDSVYDSSLVLSVDNSNNRKLIYVFSDGDDNADQYTIQNTQTALTLVDTARNIPVIGGYYNIVPSLMVLPKGRRVNNTALDQIANLTGGSTYTVVTDNDILNSINFAVSGSEGAIGYGTFTYTIDLGDVSPIYSFTANFVIPSGTSATWQVRIAGKDKIFSDYVDSLAPNTTWYFNNQEAQYLQFFAILRSTLETNEYGQETPLITGLNVIYHRSQTSYVYLTLEKPVDGVTQLAVTFDATRPKLSSLDAGVATSDRHDWRRYYGDSQLSVNQHGKIIVPVRRQVTINGTLEPLDMIDSYTYRARYGEWDLESEIAIYDGTNTLINASQYGVFPKDGYVVFNYPPSKTCYISITNKPKFKVGAKIVNRIAETPIEIAGAGYMYTTTNSLPTATPAFVQAFNLILLPFNPTTASVFQATYAFYDINGTAEDTSLTQLKWYKVDSTGVPTELTDLANLRTFDNKVTNILSSGDQLYFTVKPSDGNLYGQVVKSLTVQVASNSNISATNLAILPSPATADSAFLGIYTFVSTNGSPETGSLIKWYKNGAVVMSLNNITSWDNNGSPTADAKKGDTLYFTVQPSDGRSFGPIATSPVVTLTS